LGKFREIDPCQILPDAKKFDLRNKHPGTEYENIEANVIIFASSQARVIVRPSGTEKKIKFYIEFFSQATDRIDLANKKLILRQKIVVSRMVIDNLIGKMHEICD
jgi:phosphomannomutase